MIYYEVFCFFLELATFDKEQNRAKTAKRCLVGDIVSRRCRMNPESKQCIIVICSELVRMFCCGVDRALCFQSKSKYDKSYILREPWSLLLRTR